MFYVLFLETSFTDENAPNEMAGSDVRPKGARPPVGRSNPSFPNSRKKHNRKRKKTTKHMAFKHNTNSETKAEQNERKLKLSYCRGFVYLQNLKSLSEIDSGKVTSIACF